MRPLSAVISYLTDHSADGDVTMSDQLAILKQYECGPVPLPADPSAGFDRHLVFDHVVDPSQVTLRQRF